MIISLIESLYHTHSSLPEEPDSYKQAIEDIEYFGVSPQIYHLLNRRGLLDHTPMFFQNRLKQAYNQTLLQNILIRNRTWSLLEKFEDSEIQVIPLKGVLFGEKYFGHLGARGTSDIDLLIKRSDLIKSIACVKSLGYVVEEELIPSHFHCSFRKQLPNSPLSLRVELHWDLLKEHTSDLNIQAFWDEAAPFGPFHYVKELSDFHAFYMICLHGWRHQLNSMKYFLDIIQMIYVLRNTLDYTILLKDARQHKTLKRVSKTLAIVYDQFPTLKDVKPFPAIKKSALWWEYKAIREKRYITFRQYLNLLQFEILDFDSFQHSLLALFRWVLPSRVELLFELGPLGKESLLFLEYLRLYKKRSSSLQKLFTK